MQENDDILQNRMIDSEAEIPLETTTIDTSENIQNETNPEETSQSKTSSHTEPTTPGIERLLEDMAQHSNGNPIIMRLAKKIQGFLARIAELDAERLQADNDLQASIKEEENARAQARDRIAAQKVAKEKLAQAIKEEQEASALAAQATNAGQEAAKRNKNLRKDRKN